jgi:DNA-binding PadR family transcriptional regulator
MSDSRNPDDLLPLTPRVFLILWALTGQELHGYALLREVETLSRGRVTIKPGSLYEAIDTLAKRGLIEETGFEKGDGGPRRRPYRLTAFGRGVFDAEAQRLEELVADLRDARPAG